MLPQPFPYLACGMLKVAIFAFGLAVIAEARAADVEIRVAEQISATADFRAGKAGKPAILILHGFLQTREFSTVRSLAGALADAGYTVLTPTLALGISYRKQSMSCEALHLHDMAGDLKEIQLWMKWLRSRGYAKVVGVGHSFGATQLLAWAGQHPDKNFNLIGISPIGSTSSPASDQVRIKTQNKPGTELLHAPLSFCETYTAPASQYASYAKWDEKKLLAAIKSSGIKVDAILGDADKFLPKGWEGQLAKAGARTHVVKGANHFMDGTHEFDMVETTLGILPKS